jgi:hypothetical protein
MDKSICSAGCVIYIYGVSLKCAALSIFLACFVRVIYFCIKTEQWQRFHGKKQPAS